MEIVSPDSRHRDGVEKLAEYEEAGVREYWVIDRSRRQAEFFDFHLLLFCVWNSILDNVGAASRSDVKKARN